MRLLIVEFSHSSGTRTVLREIIPRFALACDKLFYCGHNAIHWRPLLGSNALSFGEMIICHQSWIDKFYRRLKTDNFIYNSIWVYIERFIGDNQISHVFFPWLLDHPIPRLSVPTSGMFMDLLWRHYSQDFLKADFTESTLIKNLWNINIAFPVSNSVSKELVETFDLGGVRLATIPHGARLHRNLFSTQPERNIQQDRVSDYFLYPAQTTANKNHLSLFKAIKTLVEQNLSPTLICTSQSVARLRDGEALSPYQQVLRNWLDENPKLLGTNIILRGEVEWDELDQLYNDCLAVILPSLYEGFGLPLLEALERNVPVICSGIRAFQEQIQRYEMADHVTIFNHVDPHGLVSAIHQAIIAPRVHPLASSLLLQRLSKWTWEDAAKKYLECMRDC